MSIYYTYKILFSSGHYYIGRRKCPENKTPETDEYYGSPVSNERYWKKYTFKKEILETFNSSAYHIENEDFYLGDKWKTDPLCLNNSPANSFSNSGLIWCNDGSKEYMYSFIPEGFKKGRIGTSAKGKRYYTNGTDSKMFEEGSEPMGWKLGNHNSKGDKNCSRTHGSSTKNKMVFNNGEETIYLSREETIPAGYVPGRTKDFCSKRKHAVSGKNNPRYGTRGEKWYNNGTINKLCIPGNEPKGFVRGMRKNERR